MAEELERAAKGGDYDFVQAHNVAFIEVARKLVKDIEVILKQIELNNPKEKKKQPEKETLDRLRDACVQHEMDTVDSIIAELVSFEYESGDDLVAWLRDNAEQMNYTEMVEKLSISG